jgi:hypothetical protein
LVAGDTYVWAVTKGTITAGAGTNSITVTWNVVGAGTVDVTETITLTGCSKAATQKAVTVNSLPVPTITGLNPVCITSTGNYTTEAGMSGYTWNISAGNVINSGSGTNTVSVTWNSSGAQTISVNYTDGNGCIAASPTIKSITVGISPSSATITPVATPLCSGADAQLQLNITGGVPPFNVIVDNGVGALVVPGFTYNYDLGTGLTVGSHGYNITSIIDACSNSFASLGTTATIVVNPLPAPVITGSATVCNGTTGSVYSTPNVVGHT